MDLSAYSLCLLALQTHREKTRRSSDVRSLKQVNTFLDVVAFPLSQKVEFFRRHLEQLQKFVAGQILL